MVSKIEPFFHQYFEEVKRIYNRGDYTELTFRHSFQSFIENLNGQITLSGENKKIKSIGRPDYTCYKKKIIKIGYIETKDLGLISTDKGLKKILENEQIVRYSNEAIPNMIITDYMRFVLYRKKELILEINLFSEDDLKKGSVGFNSETIKKFDQLVEVFLSYDLPTIKNSRELASELSKRAKLLRDWSNKQLNEDFESIKKEEIGSPVYYFYQAFKELIKDAEPVDCVDAYAQTITYGLFLSKIGSHDGVSRDSAVNFIPSSIKIIKTIFKNITGDELPHDLSWIVDEIVDILNATDVEKILSEFVFEGKNYKDPFIHFYENFLEEYDPKKRKHMGVYYTPEPVVSFITRSINEILKKEFGKNTGFADDSVKVLDFATGTGTFLANGFILALQEIRKAGLTGIERQKIKNHLLKNFYGFEILVSPYVIAHLKLGVLLHKEGYEIQGDERAQVYLTNTLTDPNETLTKLTGFMKDFTIETLKSNSIKKDVPILVVMGNPPYSVSSSNKSDWIIGLMKDYKKDLNERNIQPLDDDYIKFIRFAQWKIEQNKEGVLGIITNNRYLDGIIHRQMRKEILKSFNQIYLLNLHGSSKRIAQAKDENVFDIQQGVSIGIFVKNKDKKQVFYSELLGSRESKYSKLYDLDVKKIDWQELKPNEPNYFFVKKDDTGLSKYTKFFNLTQIFSTYTTGVKTHRDSFIVKDSDKEIIDNLEKLRQVQLSQDLKKQLNCTEKEEKSFINHLKGIENLKDKIIDYDYRIFDMKKIFYDTILITRHREKIMKNMLKRNVCLATTRFISGNKFDHVFCSEQISDICLLSTKTSESAYIFPLYCYNEENENAKQTTFAETKIWKSGKQPNFTVEFETFLSEKYQQTITPEETFAYIYAVLHSVKYRTTFEEFLKTDFPKIPFIEDYKDFKKLSILGNELIEYHLMKKTPPKKSIRFEIAGTDQLTKVKFDGRKIYINDTQYFNGISDEVWNFYIGGYQVLDKWLKSRKGEKLTYTEIGIFIQIASIISETIRIMERIDKIKIIFSSN